MAYPEPIPDYWKEKIDEVLKQALEDNPYPDDIYIEPTKEQYSLFHNVLKRYGLTLDKFAGAINRRCWKNAIEHVKELVKEEEQQ